MTALVIALPTAMIPSPVFGREIPTTWWAWPVLAVTSVLSGLLFATYVREPGGQESGEASINRGGAAGGLLAFFAVGCPVCNKLALIALGYTGALQWFAPVQPFLGVAAIGLLRADAPLAEPARVGAASTAARPARLLTPGSPAERQRGGPANRQRTGPVLIPGVGPAQQQPTCAPLPVGRPGLCRLGQVRAAGSTVTGTPLSTALPDTDSTTDGSVRSFIDTPGTSTALRSRTPSRACP